MLVIFLKVMLLGIALMIFSSFFIFIFENIDYPVEHEIIEKIIDLVLAWSWWIGIGMGIVGVFMCIILF